MEKPILDLVGTGKSKFTHISVKSPLERHASAHKTPRVLACKMRAKHCTGFKSAESGAGLAAARGISRLRLRRRETPHQHTYVRIRKWRAARSAQDVVGMGAY